jgi:hypothetical protein
MTPPTETGIDLRRTAEPWNEDVARWAPGKMKTLIVAAQPLIGQFYENRETAKTEV